MKPSCSLPLLAAAIAVAFNAAAPLSAQDSFPPHPTDGIIFDIPFNGSGSPLNGSSADADGRLWEAGDVFHDDGRVLRVNTGGQAAWLPFAPVEGVEYTAQVTIDNPNPDWIAFGFMSGADIDWTLTNGAVRHSNSNGYAWMLSRNHPTDGDIQAFVGPNVAGGGFSEERIDLNPVAIKIVLNTMEPIWRAEFFVNDVSRGVYSLPLDAKTGIGGIGFSRTSHGSDTTGGTLSNFTLAASTTATIPPTPPPPTVETGIVYLDSFDGEAGAPLHGASLDIGEATWTTGEVFKADGTVSALVLQQSNGQAAWLPFVPQPDAIYIAEARIHNPYQGWVAFGYMPATSATSPIWTVTNPGMRHSNSGAHAWALVRNDNSGLHQQIFNGPNTGNKLFDGNAADPEQPVDLKIVLDTTASVWTANYYINGKHLTGPHPLPASANPGSVSAIGGIGFSRSNTSVAGTDATISHFSLKALAGDAARSFVLVDFNIEPAEGSLLLTWGSEEGMTYRVESSDDLLDWEPIESGIAATGETTTYEASAPSTTSGDRAFFRVVMEL